MAPPLIQLKDIALTFGGTPLLAGVELSVSAGERVCLVGRNGSGKSTLLKIVAGLVEPDGGIRFVQPGATIRYLPQEPDFSGCATTLAYVEAGLSPGDIVLKANDAKIRNSKDFTRATREIRDAKSGVFYVLRGPEEKIFIPIKDAA